MKNLEIKAYCSDIKKVESILNSIDVELISDGFQRDTYYNIQKGILKLRETGDNGDVLIWYKRRKNAEPKISEYYIYSTENSKELKNFLKNVFSEKIIVEKFRKIYIYKNVRIHLDNVKELGNFIEFEAVLSKKGIEKESRKCINFLMDKLDIKKKDLVKYSYSEMLK